MQNPEYIGRLIFKYLRDEIDDQELDELKAWIEESEDNRRLFLQFTNKDTLLKKLSAVLQEYPVEKTETPILHFYQRPFFKTVAAAAVIIALGTTAWFHWRTKPSKPEIVKTDNEFKADINPGTNKALLTLANGSTVALDNVHTGTIGTEGNTKISKLDSSQLAYNAAINLNRGSHPELFNMLSTPRGGQYQVILADGTKVWLNAASSLRFPIYFTRNSRKVELTGEAYFEVAKNPSLPFIVQVNGMQVQVLGTHFNVMAYGNEKEIRTTLLEGSVRITQNDESLTLKPGEQARITETGKMSIAKDADVEEAIAWKNGEFQFNGASIETIMKQVERWYDVDVSYEGTIAPHAFVANISRDVPVSKLLKLLQLTGQVHFKIENKKITVTP